MGLTRRTISGMPSGQPSRVFSAVNSATKQPSWRLPSWCTEVSQAASGRRTMAFSSSSVIFVLHLRDHADLAATTATATT
ncbi:hypothetical protein, partial [Streptomyces sodiiphilus]|uniref:hypothetical protein n=1 Tax=Streptomyces sodiiphilus TaxID=226217 RepID=UPI0031D63BE8